MTDLSGRTALVTGAGKGIGAATATRLAEAGATVFVADIDKGSADDTATKIGGHSVELDVTQASQWSSSVDKIAASEGRLDILVNNAGIMQVTPFLQTDLDNFRLQHRINVEGPWLGMQACHALLSKSATDTTGSSIINMSSIYGQLGGRGVAAYSATKGAIRLLSKTVAVEFAEAGSKIRVNSVHPGPVNTDLLREVIEESVEAGLIPGVNEGLQIAGATIPMGRIAKADDIADAVVFLASDASKYMTGTEITVDGGFSVV